MRTENNPTNEAKATDPDQSRPDVSNSNGKKEKGMTKKKAKRPPVFKIRAEVMIWRNKDEGSLCGERPALLVVEELVATTVPNRQDMKSMVLSTVRGKLAHFFGNTSECQLDIHQADFLAAKSRNYGGTVFEDEPEWVPAVDQCLPDGAKRDEAIRSLTYLPYDRREQFEIYGA